MTSQVTDADFDCISCGMNTLDEYPVMLRDELWLRIVPGGNGMLCIGCMEGRLGRRLTRSDFRIHSVTGQLICGSWKG